MSGADGAEAGVPWYVVEPAEEEEEEEDGYAPVRRATADPGVGGSGVGGGRFDRSLTARFGNTMRTLKNKLSPVRDRHTGGVVATYDSMLI